MTGADNPLTTADILVVGAPEWAKEIADAVTPHTTGTVTAASDGEAAVGTVHQELPDCIVSAFELPDHDGLWLLKAVREGHPDLPFLLCPTASSEELASKAISLGVDDYVPMGDMDGAPGDVLLPRMATAIRRARRTITRRERARQFDAMFHDDRTLTWILDPNGTLSRVNKSARTLIGAPVDECIGQPFWNLPWWPSEQVQADVKQVVDTAMQGQVGTVVVMEIASENEPGLVELTARPVHDPLGGLDSIVVEGVDISDRVTVERDLRQSEELHRVTLNNMTDTVLITDDAGQFTYVCPNVHFIFGYTASEIRDIGSIDGLLGEDLFDRAELEREGVLKNIECTATDKAGGEHTLLVNVREVAIQDGSLLYSCRDITKRKQRERALTSLQGTARDFLFAETQQAIANRIIDDVPAVLNTDASAVYLFDAGENELRPAAVSSAFEQLHGPPPSISVDADTLPSYCFVEDDSLFFDDVHRSSRLENPATGIRSAAYIPLGDHGVFIAAAPDSGHFDDVERELADLLAASGEAALERVKRESRLREQERELQTRNRQLTAVNRVNEIIREIDQALVQAETRGEAAHAVCDRLTDDERFAFAWIGEVDPVGDVVSPTAFAGDDQGYLDSFSIRVGASDTEPAGRTAATRTVTLVSNVAEELRAEPWRKEALSRDYRSVMSVPLVYGDVSYGVLAVYAGVQGAFDELTREVLVELGETIASAISAITRTNALLTPTVVRVEFASTDSSSLLARLASAVECSITYQGGAQSTSVGSFVFVSFEGATAEAVERAAERLMAIERVHRISQYESGGVLRLELSHPFFAVDLADHGAVLRSVTANSEGTSLVVDVPESVDLRHITRLVSEAVGDVTLQSKQTVEQAEPGQFHSRALEQLTDRQLEVIQTAYYSGFFDIPRQNTGEDVAETLGISPQAFYKHTRAVQRKLFATLFDEVTAPPHPHPTDG